MISSSIAKVVISGTYKRSPSTLRSQYHELIETSCQVLSPRSIVFDEEEFVRSKGETHLSLRAVEDNHLAAIKEADFMWLHCPDGYVGMSGAFEIGYAHAHDIPIFSNTMPSDVTLREYVKECRSVFEAKQLALRQE